MKTKFRTTVSRSYNLTVTEDDGNEIELEVDHEVADHHDIHVHREGDHLVVAYLSHDDDAMHPLDDCDGMGKVLGRGRYKTRNQAEGETEILSMMGMDREGEPDYSLVADDIQADWVMHLDALSESTWDKIAFTMGIDISENREVLFKLQDELKAVDIVHEGSTAYAVREAEAYVPCDEATSAQCRVAADIIDWDFEVAATTIWRQALDDGRIGDPYVVLLDVYDHSGLHWSIHGGGMNCRWDTSRGAGVWVPDQSLRDMLLEPNPSWAHYMVREAPVRLRGKDNKYQLLRVDQHNGALSCVEMSDDFSVLHTKAQQLASAEPPASMSVVMKARREMCEVWAQQALNEYNAWLSGDCWGICVEEFKLTADGWEPLDQDACWGFVRSEWAEETMLTDYFNPAVKRLRDSVTA